MSSEEQTSLVENLQLDDSNDNKDDEEVVSKYFAHEETEKPKCDLGTDKSEDAKDLTSVSESEENSCTKDSEKSSRTEESIEPMNIILEKEELITKTEEKSEEKEDTTDSYQKQFDIGDEELKEVEKDCENDQNLQKKVIANKNDNAAISEVETFVEYTAGDFGSPDSESDMKIDNDDNMDIYLSSSQIESEEAEQKALSEDGTESGQQTSHEAENQEGKRRKENRKKYERNKLRKRFSDRDTENYRNGYPDMKDDLELNDNIKFYRGQIPSSPDGALIDDIHKNWLGEYKLLESHHGYIQWLFPIKEHGMNWQAQPLQPHEAEAIKEDPIARKRVLESYKLMLDFYGMKLVDEETGELDRSENWKERFDNLNWSSHNYLRITRILKCLGELGYEHLKKGLLQFILEEALERHTLGRTLTSCRDYWIGTIKNDKDREELYNYIDHHDEGNSRITTLDLVWHARNLWVYKTFCWRLLLKLAYFPLSVLWWLMTLIFGKFEIGD